MEFRRRPHTKIRRPSAGLHTRHRWPAASRTANRPARSAPQNHFSAANTTRTLFPLPIPISNSKY